MMTLFQLSALLGALLSTTAGMTMKQSPVPAAPAATVPGENAMANTYGFLRTASNNVGNTIEGVLGVEGSLTDMKKDLDGEYQRWKEKKKVLLTDRDKLNSEHDRLKNVLMQQQEMKQEVDRINGNIATKKAENVKAAAENMEKENKRKLERKGMEEDIDALKCATKTIQQAKQARLDAANRKTAALKDQNRVLQQSVFELNKDFTSLTESSKKQSITDNEAVSALLAAVEALQTQIHGLEKQLMIQAQHEESVSRAREHVSTQTSETVRQRQMLNQAQAECAANKQKMKLDIEAAKKALSNANNEMIQCQNLDGVNQQLQTQLNGCIAKKRSER